ncbi:L,D-transpeptidase family protein [Hoyosella rhizosphaerae]|uniref:L,D-transpeptidase 2 n=1 Tax=Hoyosella rhizosphaerae TaxID=1755582 RepID=A0A916XIF5_9ACTN|nr:Ig-like domain-containing protein [Hoyosella rhizosphaerae]MBN4928150.1 L,D-transpeptidase family protein [Hoyosella rhizosphaerae]GGC72810.1 L,D-transpeptidase 2 [Hoyosella rhizosphaerae]
MAITVPKKHRQRWAVAATFAAGALFLTTACTIPVSDEPPAPVAPAISLSEPDGKQGTDPIEPFSVTVDNGTITTATLTNPEGKVVESEMSADRTSWATAEVLGYGRTYTLEVEATGPGGTTQTTSQFTTLTPSNLTMPYLMPWDGAVVGIGQPVAVQFDEPIPDRERAQELITITTEPTVEGAFYWVSNREVRWRPEEYWAPGTTITVDVDVYGRDLGDGLFGEANRNVTFTIGDAVIATADDLTKTISVAVNGEVVYTMPTSFGKARTPTPNGTYIIGDRQRSMIMDSSTYGVPVSSSDGYRTRVEWATRMSYSGIFVHSAPWSLGDQGYRNVSAGCLNVSPANAQWFYNNTKPGDLVIVRNTVGGTLSGIDGLGDWNIPWETWKAGNANSGVA